MATDTTLTSVFVEQRILTSSELDAALAMRTDVSEDIGAFLVRKAMISEHDRVRCVGLQHGIQFIELSGNELDLKPRT